MSSTSISYYFVMAYTDIDCWTVIVASAEWHRMKSHLLWGCSIVNWAFLFSHSCLHNGFRLWFALFCLIKLAYSFLCIDNVIIFMTAAVCWPPALLTRPARSGGPPTSHWWRSWASRATTQERRLAAGCGTVLSPGTHSISSQVNTRDLSKLIYMYITYV